MAPTIEAQDERAIAAQLAAAVAAGPDPEGATPRLSRFIEAARDGGGLAAAVPDGAAARLLAILLGQSEALSTQLLRDPGALARLAADPWLGREKPELEVRTELSARIGAALAGAGDETRVTAVEKALRRYVQAEYLRLGARELGYGAPEEVGRELSALASACLDGALDEAARELRDRHGAPLTDAGARCRFAVLGLGKLGGEELNFSSDIDLLYLYETDAGAAGAHSLHEHFARLCERLTHLVGETTALGRCFRVDLRLRPEGNRGPICNSLPALERYYESWGSPGERQALIKARVVAGDRDLGDEALAVLEPFVWPRSHGRAAEVVGEVQALLARIRSELPDGDRDVKLGPGGIREIEFFVQALQLVHGGRRRDLRERGTLRALDKLLFAGLCSEREHRALGDAYQFLRRVEHRLQLDALLQTHALPDGPRRALHARRLGYADLAEFELTLRGHRARVTAIYRSLGRADEEIAAAGPHASQAIAALLDGERGREAHVAALASLGFRDPDTAAEELAVLRRRPRAPLSPTAPRAAARVAPLLLAEACASPDPDQALRRLTDFTGVGGIRRHTGGDDALWTLLAEHRPVARLLMSLFGTSDYLARLLCANPDLVELLATFGRGSPSRTRAEHAAAIHQRLAARADDDQTGLDEEARLTALRRYRNEELLRIGLHDVGGSLDADQVSAELSVLAEACLASALAVAGGAVAARYGAPATPLLVLGLGKLGGGELSYSSDLDVVFVFGDEDEPVAPVDGAPGGPRGPGAFELASRIAQRMIRGLEAPLAGGRLYEVDTRLRPSGQRGALVSSLAGFARYHDGAAALWERQALIKARAIAAWPEGPAAEELARTALGICARHVWDGPPLDPARTAAEIARLRDRMERERAAEGPGRHDLKIGPGGLVDVEFVVQYLQLVGGPGDVSLRERGTRPALAALHAAGLLSDEEHARLDEGYRFLRRLENRLRIVHDRAIHAFSSTSDAELDTLARRLGARGASPGPRLLADYLDHTRAIRSIYLRHLPPPP